MIYNQNEIEKFHKIATILVNKLEESMVPEKIDYQMATNAINNFRRKFSNLYGDIKIELGL